MPEASWKQRQDAAQARMTANQQAQVERAAFYRLRKQGFSAPEAAAIAQGKKPVRYKAKKVEEVEQKVADNETNENEDESGGEGETPKIEIPDDWEKLPWPKMRSLASSLTEETVNNREDCEAVIRAELAAREEDDSA